MGIIPLKFAHRKLQKTIKLNTLLTERKPQAFLHGLPKKTVQKLC